MDNVVKQFNKMSGTVKTITNFLPWASADLSDRQAAQGKRIAGDVLIGVGGAVLATGIVLLVLDALDASEAPASQQTTLSPLFLPGGAGVRAQITF